MRFTDSGGDGIPVVLTHGAGMDASTWDAQAAALAADGHRVVVWDLRGHGSSTLDPRRRFTAADALDDLAALLDAVGAERAVLVGHSLGGNLSQAFAHAHPDRVAGLVVVDATWNAGPLTGLERFGLTISTPVMGMFPAGSLARTMARASAVTPAAIARAEEVLARMPRRRFLDVFGATTSLLDPDPARRTPVPLALIRGERDRTGNIATAMPRWAQAEGVAERVIPDAGHLVSWDAPDATTRELRDILAGWGVR